MSTYQGFPEPTVRAEKACRDHGRHSVRRRVLAGLSAGFLTGAFLVASAPAAQAATEVRVPGNTLNVQMSSSRDHNVTVSLIANTDTCQADRAIKSPGARDEATTPRHSFASNRKILLMNPASSPKPKT